MTETKTEAEVDQEVREKFPNSNSHLSKYPYTEALCGAALDHSYKGTFAGFDRCYECNKIARSKGWKIP